MYYSSSIISLFSFTIISSLDHIFHHEITMSSLVLFYSALSHIFISSSPPIISQSSPPPLLIISQSPPFFSTTTSLLSPLLLILSATSLLFSPLPLLSTIHSLSILSSPHIPTHPTHPHTPPVLCCRRGRADATALVRCAEFIRSTQSVLGDGLGPVR